MSQRQPHKAARVYQTLWGLVEVTTGGLACDADGPEDLARCGHCAACRFENGETPIMVYPVDMPSADMLQVKPPS